MAETNASEPEPAQAAPPGGDPAQDDRARRRRLRTRAIAVLVVLAAASFFFVRWLLGRGKESTDDAQIQGRVYDVSARVSGQIARLLVADNQSVAAGDLLIELDTRELRARLVAARADLDATEAGLTTADAELHLAEENARADLYQASGGVVQASSNVTASRDSIEQAQATVDAALAERDLARVELERSSRLFAQGAVARADLDQRTTQFDQASASLSTARARLAAAHADTGAAAGGVRAAHGRLVAARTGPRRIEVAEAAVCSAAARIEQAQAAVELAELDLSYTEVRAPVAGFVSRRQVEEGDLVGPDRPFLSIVPLDDIWVVANFKETQLVGIRAGQRVDVSVDTYRGRHFPAHVDSIEAATGARFSLLPPDNASGNYVKVVQRVPVLIRFDALPAVPLYPGLSVEATVHLK